MLNLILPLISAVLGVAPPAASTADVGVVDARGDEVAWRATSPRGAQVRLAEALAEADAIHAIAGRGRTVTFAIDHGGAAIELAVTTGARGEVLRVDRARRGDALGGPGGLSWLAPELAETTAVTRLVVDDDGAVTILTSDRRRYVAIPGRGSGGNAAVSARWAAAWDGAARDPG